MAAGRRGLQLDLMVVKNFGQGRVIDSWSCVWMKRGGPKKVSVSFLPVLASEGDSELKDMILAMLYLKTHANRRISYCVLACIDGRRHLCISPKQMTLDTSTSRSADASRARYARSWPQHSCCRPSNSAPHSGRIWFPSSSPPKFLGRNTIHRWWIRLHRRMLLVISLPVNTTLWSPLLTLLACWAERIFYVVNKVHLR